MLVPVEPVDHDVLEAWLGERRGTKVHIAVPERGRNAGFTGGDAQCRRGPSIGTSCGGRQTQGPALAHRARRPAGARAGAAPHRVLRRLGPPGLPARSGRWWCSRTGCRRDRTTAGSRSRGPRTGRLRIHGRDAPPPVHEAARGAGREPGRGPTLLYPPALVVVDGGQGRLSMASKVLGDLGLSIPHIGLAKRLEEVYFPDHREPLLIPRGSRR